MKKTLISKLLLVFVFFHAVGFVPGIDVQPTFFLLATLIVLLFNYRIKFNLIHFIVFLVCISAVFSAYIFQIDHLTAKYTLTYLVAILTAWYISVLLENGFIDNITYRAILFVVGVYALVGVVQFYIPDFLSFLVTRSEDAAESFSKTGRGVRSLTGEPAHLGKVFSLLNILFIFVFTLNYTGKKYKQKILLVTILLFLINVFVSRSAYAIAFHFLILATLLFFIYRKLFLIGLLISILSGSLFISFLLSIESDIRFVRLFIALFDNPDFLMAQGAIKRLFNIPMSLNNLTYFDWYGAGNNPKSCPTSIATPFGEYNYEVINRGYGGYLEYILKFGVFSIPIMFIYFYMLSKITRLVIYIDNKPYKLGYFFSIVLFVFTVQDGTPVNPLPIFVLIYIYLHICCYNSKKLYV